MSELKCPFCQQALQPTSIFDNRDKRCVWYCPNCATNKGLWVMANELVWQELIRTCKALDVAKLILKNLLPDLDGYERLDVEKALNEITALEQKDK